jgi:transcription-repair coupling factor (superfamily II helicase)
MSLNGIVEVICSSRSFRALSAQIVARQINAPLQLMRAARLPVAAALATRSTRVIYVASSVEASRTATDALKRLIDTDTVLRLAEPNTAFYDTVAPVADIIAQRSTALASLIAPDARSVALVASPRALMQPTLTRAQAQHLTQILRRDDTLALEDTLAHWVRMGYEPETVVERVGAFSRRGGIIDVWSPAMPQPVRIDLFGDQIDSMRLFDPSTQRSGGVINTLTVTPLESPTLLAQASSTLIEHLRDDDVLLLDDEAELNDAWQTLEAKAERERNSMSIADDVPTPYVQWTDFQRASFVVNRVVLGNDIEGNTLSRHELANEFSAPPHFGGQLTPVLEHLKQAQTIEAQHIAIISRQAARLAEMWSQKNDANIKASDELPHAPTDTLTFVNGALPGGFIFRPSAIQPSAVAPPSLTLLTDNELFGYVRPEPTLSSRTRKAAPERAFSDWQIGDAVVHEDYGIGLYRGLVKLTVAVTPTDEERRSSHSTEAEREYLLLEYADANRLYVPLHQLDRISRYIGSDDSSPRLDKLGSGEWQLARQKAKGAAAEVAREMLKLYAERELANGHPFAKDSNWQNELEASFAYVETDDQLKAIQEVKADMERARPMDRLICGDVGFGKTEVALRAAFKAVQDGKQVAVLVPTTVLAQQHWTTFSKRLASYPIRVEMLSRFRTAAEKRKVREGLRDGNIEIVIGTHGLVSEGVQFKDLGLVIIDEEHRFGIKDKERLKKLRTSVDVLTLSATPIPRTLYLGLTNIRDISRIETAPAERLPIITHVGANDDNIIQQAIRRELDRDGQVFFVHNRVQTIGLLQQKLERLIPEARMAVAHGQMEERKLARVMSDFADGKTDILLCTNIIESGLDIPNANTIVVDRADHFGLGELYQLRGRVGRSTTQAYAYFLHDKRTRMTDDARERLETMREAAGLGAGYMIAMRDLELRGAGDMLGPKQSGQVASVGLDLYTRLLAREVGTLRAMRDGTAPPNEEAKPMTIDLPLAVGLPESYIPEATLRVQMYRRVASLDSEAKIVAFEDELQDRFGKLPPAALNLTYQARLKLAASKFSAQSITTESNRFTIRAETIEQIPRARLELLLGESGLIGRKQLSFLRSGTPDEWKAKLMDVVTRMALMEEVGIRN